MYDDPVAKVAAAVTPRPLHERDVYEVPLETSRLRVLALGIRGIPGVEGGIETHAEKLYPRLARLGCDVEVCVRTPFIARGTRSFGPVRLRRIWSPRRRGLEALVHSLLSVAYAGVVRPDVVHVHAVGPSIVVPLARLMGLRVVMTHHGPDYDRDKWGSVSRLVLRLGERFGVTCSNSRIAISGVIRDLIRRKYGRDAFLIVNGVEPVEPAVETDAIAKFGLEPGRYFLNVGRLVPEKRQLDLIRAFASAGIPGWRLALAGGIDGHEYSRRVEDAAREAGVVMTGFVRGDALEQLYSHAGGFVLPSTHEGLPIALLEAMSYGVPVLASDIPANLEVGLGEANYFRVGDADSLAEGLRRLAAVPATAQTRERQRQHVASRYDWDRIAFETLEVFRRARDGA